MPEGPEIKRAADQIAAAIEGRRALQVSFAHGHLKRHESELQGRRITRVAPRGKALLTHFEGGRVIYSHNQLYGRWYVCRPERPPRTGRQLRLAIHTRERWALLYSASEIEVLDADRLDEHPFLARLGPDLLDPRTRPAKIRRRLVDPRFRRRRLGALLLDQGFLAGTGNYLRSEILHFAGLHPDRRPVDCAEAELAELARQALRLGRRAYRLKGVTDDSARVAEGKRQGLPRRIWRHAVFGLAGRPCPRCGTPIEKHSAGGRRCYLCPRCQPAAPAQGSGASSDTAAGRSAPST